MKADAETVEPAVENAVVDLGNAVLGDSTDMREQINSEETTEQDLYRESLSLLFGLFFEGLDISRLREIASGDSFEEVARRIRTELDAAQLASAYESLLELTFRVDTDSWVVSLDRAKRHDRKTTGSYYTPSALVGRILDWTLDPAINNALSACDPETTLLDLKVLDPACGSGHFLSAAANRMGSALAALRAAQSSPSAAEIERAHGDVVQNCIFGVDIDPIAVELCKFALLSGSSESTTTENAALNCRIRCGNSLLGLTPKLLADSTHNELDVDHLRPFHWHLEFPDVFRGTQANSTTGWFGGFDVIVGNPPFLNQLKTSTVQSKKIAAFLKRRYPGVAKGYTDTAAVFAELSSQLVRPDCGRVGLVQPVSILASGDTIGVRRTLTDRGTLETLWVASEGVFGASVRTCVVVFRNGEKPSTGELRRFVGLDFSPLSPLPISEDEIDDMETWAPLIADGFGVPAVELDQSHTLGEVLEATADFRDQYYGLVPFVEEAHGRVPDGVGCAALVTVGLIEPADLLWGKRPTKFNKVSYNSPVVDLERLRIESDLGDWATTRLVPKLLLATQTRVVEVVVDESGVLLPSVPVITVTTQDISLWHAAVALMSPPITAWVAARYMGAALSIGALKLSASQVQNLPMPAASADWDRAAQMIRGATGPSSSPERRQKLVDAGSLMCNAYRVADTDQLMNWWCNRLGKERSS